jgi:uncharacterized protein YndB with AHSA1/START domain
LSSLALELDRLLPASPEVVFAAFADPEQLARWWGPKGFTVRGLDFPTRVGETYRIEMQPPEGSSFFLTGEFREVEPPARLAFTFRYEDPDPDDVENTVSLAFREVGDATDARLTQEPFKTAARLALHRDGWGDSFDRLEALL